MSARILTTRPPKYVTKEEPAVSEIDVYSAPFPTVRSYVPPEDERVTDQAAVFDAAVMDAGIVGDHPSIRRVLQRAAVIASTKYPVLILGETGTPNRIEERFGRIHRIGQTEVCHLWNLVAVEAREGDVYHTLLEKLEQSRQALGGQVFDVLGKIQFEDRSLRELLIEAIRYSDRPETRAKLKQAIAEAVNRLHLQDLLEDRALAHDVMDWVIPRPIGPPHPISGRVSSFQGTRRGEIDAWIAWGMLLKPPTAVFAARPRASAAHYARGPEMLQMFPASEKPDQIEALNNSTGLLDSAAS